MNGTAKFYWKLLIRRMPYMTLLFLVCTGLGLVMAVRLPTTYETSARLLVEAPQIDPSLAASTVQISGTEEIEIIRQQLMTRANLLETARSFDVFPPGENNSPGDVVEAMRDATVISARGGGPGQPVIVEVKFEARTGQIAANVVNEYVTRITSANVENRVGAAEDTLDFFEQEVEQLSAELDRRSGQISNFQRENADALPGGQAYRLDRQSLLQERISSSEREISRMRQQRDRLIELFEVTGTASTAPPERLTPQQERLLQLEQDLSSALTIYSETNPRVVQLKSQVDQARAAAQAAGSPPEADTGNPQRTLLNLQLSEIEAGITETEQQIASAESELTSLRAAIDETPLNEITLASLQRDYDNVRLQYDTAVQRMSQATVGERIELTAKGQRITLIEAANVPTEPASPNRPLVAAAGIGAGLTLAMGLFFLLELMNSAVRRPGDIQKALGIVPIATISYIESRGRRLLRRTWQVTAILVVMIGVPAGLWAIDTHYLPLDLLAQRLLDKVGLV